MLKLNRIFKFALDNIQYVILLAIMGIAVWLRLFTSGFNLILDYDPWWFFRHAQEIIQNGFLPPTWDYLSYYPAGRPVDFYLGWSYTIAAFYQLVSSFMAISLTKFAGYFVTVFAAASAIPAYFVGKMITNRWGGLATAFFAVITPTFLSVSMAGYPDSDAVDVFYTFLVVATTLYALMKSGMMSFDSMNSFKNTLVKYMPHVLPSLASFWLFAFNWNSSWYIYFIFLAFVPLMILFRIIESMIRGREVTVQSGTSWLLSLLVSKIRENKSYIFAILLIGFLGEALTVLTAGWPFNTLPLHNQFVQGLNILGTSSFGVILAVLLMGLFGAAAGAAFGRMRAVAVGGVIGAAIMVMLSFIGITGESLLVNISVAELQLVNVFTSEGFQQIVARIGWAPMTLAFAAFFITGAKLILRRHISPFEYFAVIWLLVSFWLITHGVRFSLLFSMAVATAAGFSIGSIIVQARRNMAFLSTVFAIFIIVSAFHINDNYQFTKSTGGLDINNNWREMLDWLKTNGDQDTLIVTWWDPGHIITGYTGLKVMADGAHCGPVSCTIYDHNTRIQDMGRVFSISSEEEALNILSKYRGLSDEQCSEVLQQFGGLVTEEACEPVKDMYVIASSDLIYKYYWLSYFGTGNGQNYVQYNFNQGETDRLGAPTFVYYVPQQRLLSEIILVQQNNTVISILNQYELDDSLTPVTQTVRNAIIKNTVMFTEDSIVTYDATNTSGGQNLINGMSWLDPSAQYILFMQPQVRDSIFTNMYFFLGRGNANAGIEPLENFSLVYSNPEIRVFKVSFE